MFVEATPEDRLLKMLKETEDKYRISEKHRIKFVTKSGIKLKHLLERKDPFSSKCKESDCYPCENSNVNPQQTINCRKNRVCYEVSCRNCDKEGSPKLYHGETARNIYVRSKEHYAALKNKSEKSFMLKHVIQDHEGDSTGVTFDWKIKGKYQKPLSRQLAEAILIDKKSKDVNLNSKTEYFSHSVKGIGLYSAGDKEECGYCGRKFTKIDDLQNHEEDFHTKIKCNVCEYISYGKKDLLYHTQNKHS